MCQKIINHVVDLSTRGINKKKNDFFLKAQKQLKNYNNENSRKMMFLYTIKMKFWTNSYWTKQKKKENFFIHLNIQN